MQELLDRFKYSSFYNLVNPLYQIYDYCRWLVVKRKLPVPHLVKQKLIKNLAKEYNIRTFIETGTYLGAMVQAVSNEFEKIYTVELDKKLYRRAKFIFKNNRKIRVILGDSEKKLPVLINKIHSPTIFWLDAHYSRGITSKGKLESPIKAELRCILRSKSVEYIILIDDADCFNGRGGYPLLSNLKK